MKINTTTGAGVREVDAVEKATDKSCTNSHSAESARARAEVPSSFMDQVRKRYEEKGPDTGKGLQGKNPLADGLQQPAPNGVRARGGGIADNRAVKVATVVSNLTWGLPNTLVGVAGIAIDVPVSLARGGKPDIAVSKNGKQVRYGGSLFPMRGTAASLGLVEFNHSPDWATMHEGGHAVQSALLGPFYLPAVGIDYAVNGHWNSRMEAWADNLAYGNSQATDTQDGAAEVACN